jgi:hypothetical protein
VERIEEKGRRNNRENEEQKGQWEERNREYECNLFADRGVSRSERCGSPMAVISVF